MRFNYTTGDAAGQNMVGRATFAACSWIIDNYEKEKIKAFLSRIEFCNRQKSFAGQYYANTRQARYGGMHDSAQCSDRTYARRTRIIDLSRGRGKYRLNSFGRKQQRSTFGQRNYGDVYCDRTRCGKCFGKVGSRNLFGNHARKRFVYFNYDSFINRRHPRRRHGLATQNECLQILGCFGAASTNSPKLSQALFSPVRFLWLRQFLQAIGFLRTKNTGAIVRKRCKQDENQDKQDNSFCFYPAYPVHPVNYSPSLSSFFFPVKISRITSAPGMSFSHICGAAVAISSIERKRLSNSSLVFR